ncbi:MAG: efflux RND transporter periplasmic adaptor subunit [Gammaproteobacteria bacterium]
MQPGNSKQKVLLGALLAGVVLQYAFAQDTEPKQVTKKPLREVAVYPQHSAPATVVSLNNSRISAQLNAQIETIEVKVGNRVKQGQVLAKLDCQDYVLTQQRAQAALRRAQAVRRLARQQLQRAESLASASNLSKELLNQRQSESQTARAELATAQAEIEQAQIQIARCSLTAPFDGVVMERLAGAGELANVGTPVLRLLDTSQLELSAQVPIDRVVGLTESSEQSFQQGAARYPVTLRTAVPAVNTQARNREVRLLFKNGAALPGTAGRLIWGSAQAHVPPELLVRREGRLGVFIANDAHARFEPLDGALEGQAARIDLPLDSVLVVEGMQALRDGDPLATQ